LLCNNSALLVHIPQDCIVFLLLATNAVRSEIVKIAGLVYMQTSTY